MRVAGTSPDLMDLSDYARILRSSLRLILTLAIAGLAAGAGWALLRTPIYLAEANVLVPPILNPVLQSNAVSSSLLVPDLATEAQIVRSRDVANDVRQTLQLATPAETLLNNVTVNVLEDTDTMLIGYRSVDPDTAAEVANAFASAYLDDRDQDIRAQVEDALAPIKEQIVLNEGEFADLIRQIKNERDPTAKGLLEARAITVQNRGQALEAQRAEIEAAASGVNSGRVLQSASAPASPDGPGPVTAGAMGFFLGIFAGAGVTIGRALINDRVRGGDELANRVGAPVMAIVPRIEGWSRKGRPHLITREDPTSQASEAYRTLATNLRYTASRTPLDTLTISSALPGEGKSGTAANVAVVLAQTGMRVILIAGDLRRPRLHDFFGVDNGPGLSDVLTGRLELPDVLVDTGTQNLALVRSGAVPSDPVALLANRRLGTFLAEAKGLADMVICDSPPLLPVADASILAAQSDGLLFVHDPAISTRSALIESASQMETAGVSVVGAVYNNLNRKERTYLGYTSQQYRTGGSVEIGDYQRERVRRELASNPTGAFSIQGGSSARSADGQPGRASERRAPPPKPRGK